MRYIAENTTIATVVVAKKQTLPTSIKIVIRIDITALRFH